MAYSPVPYHRITPGIKLTSWYEEVGTVVYVLSYVETGTSHRFAPFLGGPGTTSPRSPVQPWPSAYLGRAADWAIEGPDALRLVLADDVCFVPLD